MQRTKYFQNCLGVFQGGGVRGIAHVGAYKAAHERGVSFSELIGASAGSIVAVLIGAGANPERLKEFLDEINDFKMFIKDPEPCNYPVPWQINTLGAQFGKKKPGLAAITKIVFKNLGLYSSNEISDWLNKKLRLLLGIKDEKYIVQFEDLDIPTSVIVTDLKTKKVKIFGKRNENKSDEDEKKGVAFAVQCSCSIPIVFQPVKKRYVDGGAISNLPAFAFYEHPDKLYNKILAFSLEGEDAKEYTELKSYIFNVINAALDGGLNLQLALQDNVPTITINTGDVAATDFDLKKDQLNALFNKGYEAAKLFFENEADIQFTNSNYSISKDFFSTSNFITQLQQKHKEIIISFSDSDWVYHYFPTLLQWRLDGTQVYFLLEENSDNESHSAFRLRLLSSIGVNVTVVSKIPFRGFLFDSSDSNVCKAVIFRENRAEDNPFRAKNYEGAVDYVTIKLFRETLRAVNPTIPEHPSKREKLNINLKEIEKATLLDAIKNVSQYTPDGVIAELEEVEVAKVKFLKRTVNGFKYRQIENLFKLFERNGLELFKAVELVLADGKTTIVTPPVVELRNKDYVVIEANARFAYAYKNGIKKLNCVVVSGVDFPLPGLKGGLFGIRKILISDLKKVEDYDKEHDRKIEKAVRPPDKCLL